MSNPFDLSSHPLVAMLDLAVPLAIMQMNTCGGPTVEDIAKAQSYTPIAGDILLFGGNKGQAAQEFSRLAHSLAVMAFCWGGVKVFGRHWTAPTSNAPGMGLAEGEDERLPMLIQLEQARRTTEIQDLLQKGVYPNR